MIDIQFQKTLISNTTILAVLPTAASNPYAVTQDLHSQDAPDTRIWFSRNTKPPELLSPTLTGLADTFLDLECISTDIDTAQNLAQAVKTAFHGFRGSLGNGDFAHMIEIDDHDDDYLRKNENTDDGIYVCALSIRILHT